MMMSARRAMDVTWMAVYKKLRAETKQRVSVGGCSVMSAGKYSDTGCGVAMSPWTMVGRWPDTLFYTTICSLHAQFHISWAHKQTSMLCMPIVKRILYFNHCILGINFSSFLPWLDGPWLHQLDHNIFWCLITSFSSNLAGIIFHSSATFAITVPLAWTMTLWLME